MIDIQTILISYAVTNIICASLMVSLWLQNRKRFDGIGFWLGHFIAALASVILLGLRGSIPDFISIVIANALVIFGFILFYMGLEHFTGKVKSQIHNYIFLAIFTLIHSYFTYIQPSLPARNTNISVGMFIGAFQIVWLIFYRLRAEIHFKLRSLGMIFIFYCLISVADLIIDPGVDYLKTSTDSIDFLLYQILQVTLTLNLFLQVNQRLVVDLENDITERKRAEEAARAGEALYHQMFAGHSAVMVLIEPESGSIVEANLAAVNFYGYPADVLQQMNIQQINTLTSQEIVKLRQRVQIGNIKYFGVPHRLASGEIREVEVYSVPIEVNERTLLYSIIHDITERRLAEEALKESRKIAEDIFEFTPDALLMVDESGNITRVNKQTQLMFGYTREELSNQKIDILIPKRFHNNHMQNVSAFFAEPHMRPMGTRLELFAVKRDGREFPVDILLSPLLLGGKTFVTAVVRNITERKLAEEALHETQTQVIEQQRMVATFEERERMARELHDGIGQILGYVNVQAQAAQTLLESKQPEAAQKNLEGLVQVAQDANVNLRHYILGLRDSILPQRNFYEALQAYLDSFKQAWDIETIFSLPQDKLPLLPVVVEDQLLHIVQEALVNIRKHAEAKRVEVLITKQAGEMTVSISDDGHGFDLQLAPSTQGEHFGLSIMRERAEQVGGRMEIRSVIGQGTQVFIHIPIILEPMSASHENPKNMYSLRILLVDDQPLFLGGMRNLLKARGLTVIGTARDGLEALEQVKTLRPDVVLMDVQMPNCDGVEATRRIKDEFPETKIVLLTVSEDEEHLLDAIKYGASSYLLKNLDANQLFSTLDGLARGEIQVAPELASRLLREFNRSGAVMRSTDTEDTIPADLTARQWEVLRFVARGLTYKEAGRELHVTEPAIKYHMAQILDRLQLKNREQAIAYLRQVEEARKKKHH